MIKLFPKLNTKNNEVALVENGNRTTYAELNKKIDEFAKGLLGNR